MCLIEAHKNHKSFNKHKPINDYTGSGGDRLFFF